MHPPPRWYVIIRSCEPPQLCTFWKYSILWYINTILIRSVTKYQLFFTHHTIPLPFYIQTWYSCCNNHFKHEERIKEHLQRATSSYMPHGPHHDVITGTIIHTVPRCCLLHLRFEYRIKLHGGPMISALRVAMFGGSCYYWFVCLFVCWVIYFKVASIY